MSLRFFESHKDSSSTMSRLQLLRGLHGNPMGGGGKWWVANPMGGGGERENDVTRRGGVSSCFMLLSICELEVAKAPIGCRGTKSVARCILIWFLSAAKEICCVRTSEAKGRAA